MEPAVFDRVAGIGRRRMFGLIAGLTLLASGARGETPGKLPAAASAATPPSNKPSEKVVGIGGVFFKSKDPKALQRWYQDHLGLEPGEGGIVAFFPRNAGVNARDERTIWSPFPADTKYFAPSTAPFMVNFRVDHLDRMLAQLRALGDKVDARIDDSEFGRFGWVMDPEGNRVELWEPPLKK